VGDPGGAPSRVASETSALQRFESILRYCPALSALRQAA